MNILFVHQNFPGQFRHLAPALARRGHRVVALTLQDVKRQNWRGVELVPYRLPRGTAPGVHPWLADLESKVIRGQACLCAARELSAQGFAPDVIIGHPGWGETLFLKDQWPQATLALYGEFFYRAVGADVDFDPELQPPDPDAQSRIRLKNLNNLMSFEAADAVISPTQWQASTYPAWVREKLSVIHDGIDTQLAAPRADATLQVHEPGRPTETLSRSDEIITFVSRNLEPYRGYHVFMRALPELLRRRPRARVLVVGGDGVSYSARPVPGRHGGSSWRQIYEDEARLRVPAEDWARVHFLGRVPYERYLALLQVSTVHVYLTYPFVLSWSLLEAMSAGCAIVGSDTAPVREAIQHGVTGRLVDFFDTGALCEAVCDLLDEPGARARLAIAARELAHNRYDLQTVCLPRQLAWFDQLAGGAGAGAPVGPN